MFAFKITNLWGDPVLKYFFVAGYICVFFGLIHASNTKTVLAPILLCLHGHYLAYATINFFQDSAPSLTDYPTRAVCHAGPSYRYSFFLEPEK